MSQLSLYNSEGQKLKDVEVQAGLTAGPIRKGLLYYMIRYQMAKRRAGTHSSKTRGMVRGSTKKMYRQKGTGRARHGDGQAPIYVGGGRVFGPSPRDYSYTMPKAAKRRSLQTALAFKKKEEKLILLEALKWEAPKTKQAYALFKALKSDSALLVIEAGNEVIQKSVRNLPGYKVLVAEGLNVYDILYYDHLILTQGALEKVYQRLNLAA